MNPSLLYLFHLLCDYTLNLAKSNTINKGKEAYFAHSNCVPNGMEQFR